MDSAPPTLAELEAAYAAEIAKGPATEEEVRAYIESYWVRGERSWTTALMAFPERCQMGGVDGLLRELEEPYENEFRSRLQAMLDRWLQSDEARHLRMLLSRWTDDEEQLDELVKQSAAIGSTFLEKGELIPDLEQFAQWAWENRRRHDLAREITFIEIAEGTNQGGTPQ